MRISLSVMTASAVAMLMLAVRAAPANLKVVLKDADGDGRFSQAEFLDASQGGRAMLDLVFSQLDTDGDGFLSADELPKRSGSPAPVKPHGPDDEVAPAGPAGARLVGKPDPLPDAVHAVVISSTDHSNDAWRAVADALVRKHHGALIVYDGSVTNVLPALRDLSPRFVSFVARPEILGRIYVARVHRMMRQLDDDPYGDALWGIVSAASPTGAMRVATARQPLRVSSAIGLTGLDEKVYDELLVIGDSKPGEVFWKHADGKVERRSEGDADRTKLFVEAFASIQPQLLVGSGHATERNLEMPFSKGNTVCREGRWTGLENWKDPIGIANDATARVFLGAGNCLIGNFQRRASSMAATLMETYGFNQFVGYTVPTWYGKGGWGTLGLWQGQAGRLALSEAWFFNNQLILDELRTKFPDVATNEFDLSEAGEGMPEARFMRFGKDASGMLWDRDVVAFYGDPALAVRVGKEPPLDAAIDATDFRRLIVRDPAGTGIDPVCLWRLRGLKGTRVIEGAATNSLVTDDFLILRAPVWQNGRLAVRLSD